MPQNLCNFLAASLLLQAYPLFLLLKLYCCIYEFHQQLCLLLCNLLLIITQNLKLKICFHFYRTCSVSRREHFKRSFLLKKSYLPWNLICFFRIAKHVNFISQKWLKHWKSPAKSESRSYKKRQLGSYRWFLPVNWTWS